MKSRTKRLNWLFTAHCQSAIASFGRLCRNPLSSLMTIAVIGIALALPAGLTVLLDNVAEVGKDWHGDAQISVFIHLKTRQLQIDNLLEKIKLRHDVSDAVYISPDEGLKYFQSQSGFADAIAQLPENPLPPVIEVHPIESSQNPAKIKAMVASLQGFPHVENVKLDMEWVSRLYGMIHVANRAVQALSLLLALAVLLVVGNTIRLVTEHYRSEIEVINLVGATHAFIRRPYLYIGVFYGLFGAALAWGLVDVVLWWLAKPISELAGLYQSAYQLIGLGSADGITLLFSGILLGLVGAWMAVGRHLKSIEV